MPDFARLLDPFQQPTVVGVAVLVMLLLVASRSRRRVRDGFKRGARLVERRTAARLRALPADGVSVAGIALRAADETKHFKMIGSTGTGKSTAIRELLAGALRRGDRAVIADPDGGYQARFHDRYRADVILNPFESGSLRWDLFADVATRYDIEQLAHALIPDCDDASAREWRGYARTFLCAILARCQAAGWHDLGDLWRLLTTAPTAQLRFMVAGTPAQPFLETDNARMFASIRSVLGSAIAALQHIQEQRAAPFSVRAWVRDGRGVLFIPYRAGQITALRSMIAAWLRLAIVEAMQGAEDHDQRLWFIVDELDALGAIDGLKDALARLRKFGCRCVLGFQSVAQVSSTYGQGDAQTIVENCSNTLILRCSGSEQGGTSQFASRLIGEREVIRRQISRGADRDSGFNWRGARRSRNITDQRITETAVMPSEIEQLPDLCGYFKSASSAAWLRVALKHN